MDLYFLPLAVLIIDRNLAITGFKSIRKTISQYICFVLFSTPILHFQILKVFFNLIN